MTIRLLLRIQSILLIVTVAPHVSPGTRRFPTFSLGRSPEEDVLRFERSFLDDAYAIAIRRAAYRANRSLLARSQADRQRDAHDTLHESIRLNTFSEMDLFEPLNRALADLGYKQPTPIQAKTIPAAVDGRDILGCAQTGTGKTAAFALPILDYLGIEKLRARPRCPIALIMAPTRELAIQIGDSFKAYGGKTKFRQALVYGGVGQAQQVTALSRGAEVLIATPGRLLDLMEQKLVSLEDVEIFVLDEADRMLDMGFLPDLRKVIARLPRERQSMFFSATMPPKIRELSSTLLTNPVSVDVTPAKSISVEKIRQEVRVVDRGHKVGMLCDILNGSNVDRAIVFTRTKHGANALTRKLERAGLAPAAIHGNKSQAARQKALGAFRNRKINILVATDVAARGIDIEGVTHVINFDMPVEAESYVHRIGRTGRAGADGIAISFCTAAEHEELHAIEKLIGRELVSKEELGPSQPSQNRKGNGQRRQGRSGRGCRNSNGAKGSSGRSSSRRSKARGRSGQKSRKPQTSAV